MPYFDQNPLDKLVLQPGDADSELDLHGLSLEDALAAVDGLLQSPDATGSYAIRFDPASNDGRETLFQPVGRRLLQARRERQLNSCLPLADGAGYFISFPD